MNGILGGLGPLFATLFGGVLLFIGERILGVGHDLRIPLSALGSLLVLAAVVARGLAALRSVGALRRVYGGIALAYGVSALGLALYGLGLTLPEDAAPKGMIDALWPILWLGGLLPGALMETSLRTMVGAQVIEVRRVMASGRSGLAVALALSWLVALNYVADARDVRFDLRSVKDLTPSEASREMVRNLPDPLVITLFFPPANEVGEAVDPYFEALAQLSPNLTLDRMDRDVYPQRAKELKARGNGTVVFSKGDLHEALRLDTDMGRARRKLKSLDEDVQSHLAKVSRDKRMAYLVTGHGERSTTPRSDDPAPGLKDLKKALESLNYGVKRLGLSEGLATAVPEDATLVIVAGPTSPMLPAEEAALSRYLAGGGAMMILLDPEVESDPELTGLLGPLGLTVDRTPLANDQKFVRLTGGKSDRAVLFTNRFMAHDSTRTLARLSTQIALVFPVTGSLRRLEDAPKEGEGDTQDTGASGADVRITVRSLPGTFADADGDLTAGPDEPRQVFDLVAAARLPDLGDGRKGGRAIVAADVDLISDKVLRLNAGNQQWLVDSVRYLEDDLELSGALSEPEDVPILHSRDEDQALFYGTVLGMPLLILALGGLGIWARRREEQP